SSGEQRVLAGVKLQHVDFIYLRGEKNFVRLIRTIIKAPTENPSACDGFTGFNDAAFHPPRPGP
ncbi:hypothetical protein KDV48_11245, partial [Citrobacter sedlakii]|uniref:hypothetical protein n=1 Tax=Citrobacter sedlakii TaxID=67826 RepID=UPI003336CBF1